MKPALHTVLAAALVGSACGPGETGDGGVPDTPDPVARAGPETDWEIGHVFRDCGNCPEMVVVAAGSFMMGSPDAEQGRLASEGPLHRVTIPAPFAAGAHEVTFDEWDHCLAEGGCGGYRPDDDGSGRGRRPVAGVSWDDAQLYLSWLSARTDRRYRLPSEAEWEYAARAGTTTPYHTGESISTSQANFNGVEIGERSRGKSLPVGSFPPNAFGLHDVHGNANEWVQDCWNASYEGAPADGAAWEAGACAKRILRGCSYGDRLGCLRSASRAGLPKEIRGMALGFRVARALESR